MNCKIVVSALLFLLLSGCARVPIYEVWRPWTRENRSEETVLLGARMKTEVLGQTLPLLGSEELTKNTIRRELDSLLVRRGFIIVDNSYDLLLKLSYKTERNDKMKSISSSSFTAYQGTYLSAETFSGSTNGLGVSIAKAVLNASMYSRASSLNVTAELLNYVHTFSIEISDRTGKIIWKVESTYDSEELDILSNIKSNLQLMLSSLPADQNVKPAIPAVRRDRKNNFMKLSCEGRIFSCPALPYRIFFTRYYEGVISYLGGIENPEALAAYVDLVQTAEYALPQGSDDWTNPLDIYLWTKVMLGGQYLLGPNNKPINVLIELTGEKDGYNIKNCRIAADGEFQKFQINLSKWQNAIKDYYNVFER